MVKGLLAVLARLRSAWLFEAAGAGLVTWGVYEFHGVGGAAITAGVAVLAKSVELDARGER